ncbi:Aspartyl aminopeptidase [Balamuthia mandrillaris]
MEQQPMQPSSREEECVQGFLDFVNGSTSAFHAVQNAKDLLLQQGFVQLKEGQEWELRPGHKYFLTRNHSTILAFAVGGRYEPGNGVNMVGAHTDSPNLKVKPVSLKESKGYLCVGVETYGGGLWHTWFDRDLTVAGRVVVRTAEDKLEQRLVHIPRQDIQIRSSFFVLRSSFCFCFCFFVFFSLSFALTLFFTCSFLKRPILRVPNLAIHLTSAEERSGFNPNKQTHLGYPILATAIQKCFLSPLSLSCFFVLLLFVLRRASITSHLPSCSHKQNSQLSSSGGVEGKKKHHPILLQLLAKEMGVEASQICDFDLSVCDTQPSCVGGAFNEFIFSPRLDNLLMSYTSLMGLLESLKGDSLNEEKRIRLVALFDNEEIGSQSAYGAASNMMQQVLERIMTSLQKDKGASSDHHQRAFAQSYLISADMAHGIHPCYPEKHDENHQPAIHSGPVIKYNANQRYATTAVTAFLLKEVARRHSVPMQEFVVRNDSPCGSTIGPILSANCGVRTIDIGCPQLAMHSIREMCGTQDLVHACNLFKGFFQDFTEVDESLEVD